jgi:hypothetical protein
MPINPTTKAHFTRVVRMAEACDVDLSTALDTGAVQAQDIADMVTACCGCGQVGQCDRLLAQRPALPAAPDYCENAENFAQLREFQAG